MHRASNLSQSVATNGKFSSAAARLKSCSIYFMFGSFCSSLFGGIGNIDLDPVTVDVLRSHRARQIDEYRMTLGKGYNTDLDLVFARGDGNPHDVDVISHQFGTAVRKAAVKAIRFHDLRHTHATLGLAAGIHPKVMQERLGHSSITITMDRYSHVVPSMQQDAATRVAAIVDGLA